MGTRSERWLLKPLSCPRPIRHCPTCRDFRAFICSERFRVNAQKKVLAVWLHYRCSECGGAWKYPVLERQSVATIDAMAYEAYVRHDIHMVWRHAFDVGRLRTYVMHVDANVGVEIERSVVAGAADDEGLCIHLEAPFACEIRLDRLLAAELGVSRSKVHQWYERGQLHISPEQSGALSQRARTGQKLLLSGITRVND